MPVAGNPSFQGKCNNTLILTFNFNGDNSKVWRSDGTSDGTFAITEAMDGNGSAPAGTSDLSQYVEYNNKLYFVNRYYLYETDGTLENTNKVASLWNAQHDTLAFSDVIEVDNKLYFMFFSDTLNKLSIFKYDPALGISSEIYTNLGSQYFSPSHFAKGNNALLFTASNQNGGTSLISLDLTTGNASDLKELSDKNTTKKPFGFMEYLDATNIYKINSDEYYIKTAVTDYNRNGWILDAKLKTVENIEGFYNVWFSIVFNESLYYSKDSKLYKYANTLSTVNNQTKPLLKLFPNPSADFIQLNTGDTDDVENISIYDLSGKKVLNISNYNNGKIDISKLSQGIYNIQIRSNGSLISKKIIKK